MTPLKRSLSILGRSCRTLCSNKSFHTASPIRAKNSPKRSPAVARKLGKSTPGVLRTKKSYHAEECLPPVALLQSARKSGALEIEVEKAVEVLREYQEVEATSSKGWEQKLCNGKLINP
jgi:hypothetical protein